MDKALIEMPLQEKEAFSKRILQEGRDRYSNDIAIIFSGEKDSTALLYLVKTAFDGKIPWKVFTIDTCAEFKEIKEFTHKMAEEWNFELITLRNDEALKTIEIAKDKLECCYLLKTVPVNKAIKDYGIKAFITAVRCDEEANTIEEFFIPRENPTHMSVQPILHFKEIDIWSYIKQHNIPLCELYRKGYRFIDCKPCTRPFGSVGVKRDGEDQDREEVMRRLRAMGYL